jgi:putative spermidine/putrescine transport system substrate-binding protein
MKLKTLVLAGTALAMAGGAATAEDMTLVSWGGAYQASQKAAYADP